MLKSILFPMTLTLTLPPEMEALLRQRADRTGQDLPSMAVAVLALGLSFDDQDFFEALEGIQRGLDDFEQGQFCSLDEFVAEQNQKYGLSLEAA
jgi:predicted transcriptional regulator